MRPVAATGGVGATRLLGLGRGRWRAAASWLRQRDAWSRPTGCGNGSRSGNTSAWAGRGSHPVAARDGWPAATPAWAGRGGRRGSHPVAATGLVVATPQPEPAAADTQCSWARRVADLGWAIRDVGGGLVRWPIALQPSRGNEGLASWTAARGRRWVECWLTAGKE